MTIGPTLRPAPQGVSWFTRAVDYSASATTKVLTLATPEAGTVLIAAAIECLEAFNGGTISECTISLGITSDHDKFSSAKSVFTASGTQWSSFVGNYVFDGATDLVAVMNSTGANTSALTQGKTRTEVTLVNTQGSTTPISLESKGQTPSPNVSDLANDPSTTHDLIYGYNAGQVVYLAAGAVGVYPAGTIALTDDATNTFYVSYFLDDPQVTAGEYPRLGTYRLATIETAGGQITNIVDHRAELTAIYGEAKDVLNDLSVITDGTLDILCIGGQINTPLGEVIISGVPLTLPDATSAIWVECDVTGAVTFNLVGWTFGSYPIAILQTVSGVATVADDSRTSIYIHGPGPKHFFSTGAAAGNVTATGIKVGDRLDEVIRYTAGALVSDLTAEFTITATNTINNSGGTNTTGSVLIVRWTKLTAA